MDHPVQPLNVGTTTLLRRKKKNTEILRSDNEFLFISDDFYGSDHAVVSK